MTAGVAARTAIRQPRALALASLIVAATYLGSRVLGALESVALAGVFGTAPELDAWYVGNRIPDLIFQLIAGATLASAFIPTFARVRGREGQEAAWRLASAVLNLVALITIVLAVLAFLLAPWVVPATAPGLGNAVGRGPEMQHLAVTLARIMLLAPILFSISGMISGILNANHRFFLAGLAPMLYNVALIGGVLVYRFLFHDQSLGFGVTVLSIAAVAGAAAHLLVQIPGLFRLGMRYAAVVDVRNQAVREVIVLMLPRMLGLAAWQANFLITAFFASQMGAGTISSLNYAWLLVVLPLALIGQAISTAVFPHMADQAADEAHVELRRTVSQALRVIVFLTVPATVGLVVLRVPVVTLLLQRGQFDAESTRVTAAALLFYSLGLAAQAVIEILSRGFYALRDTRTPVIFAVLSLLLNLVFSLLLREPLGYRGLALALSLAVSVEALLLFVTLRRRIGGLEGRSLLWSVARAAAAAWAMIVLVAAFMVWARSTSLLGEHHVVRYLLEVAIGVPAGICAFLVVAWLTGAEEVRSLTQLVHGSRRRA
jgi:putative peptidoglycan lipid II flippase